MGAPQKRLRPEPPRPRHRRRNGPLSKAPFLDGHSEEWLTLTLGSTPDAQQPPCGELPVSGHVCEVASGALWRCMPLTFELDHINPVGAGRRRWAWPRVGRLTHGHDRGLERLC